MRIVALSDIHGEVEQAEGILTKEFPFDAVVVAGDLTTYGTHHDVEWMLERFMSYTKPVVAVVGNMDPPELEKTLSGVGVSINGRGVIVDNVGFFGVSASPYSPLHTPYEISEEEILKRAEAGWLDVQTARWTTFVPHAPPSDTSVDKLASGKHVGSKGVRKFIEHRQPHVTVCGHIHEARGQDRIGSTQIINGGPAGKGYYAVLTIENEVVVESRSMSQS